MGFVAILAFHMAAAGSKRPRVIFVYMMDPIRHGYIMAIDGSVAV
jgi:hypothetical protein